MDCRRRLGVVVVSLAVSGVLSGGLMAAEAGSGAATQGARKTDEASQLKLSTERAVIFKDGHGLIIKNGTATADGEGMVYTSNVPDAAVLGTFWAVGEGQKLLAMNAEWDERHEVKSRESVAVTMAELLRANVGKRATLGLPEHRTVMGTIVEVLDLPAEKHPAAAGVPGAPAGFVAEGDPIQSPFASLRSLHISRAAARYAGGGEPGSFDEEDTKTLKRELTPRAGDFVVVDETETGRLVLPVRQIETISGKEVNTHLTRKEEVFTRSKKLRFEFGKQAAGKAVTLKMFYFTPGLRWIPTYRVSGDLKEKAEIALQGEILNEVEDLSHAAVDLVVGVPNFRFKDTVSPLTLEQFLRTTLVHASPSYGARSNDFGNFISNSAYSQVAGAFRGQENNPGAAPSMAAELAGTAGEQDLFLYSMKDFSLKKGGRASTPLWQNSVPLRHVYTFDVKLVRNRAGGQSEQPQRGPNPNGSPLKFALNQVWHQLELANNSTVPWTTGAALSMRENLPLGQDLLTYTPVGGCALLPLTVAVDMPGSFDEEEIGRKPNAIRVNSSEYTLIRKKGTLTVTNFRKEKSNLKMTVTTGGKVTEASDEGKVKANDFQHTDWQEYGYHDINSHSDVTWDLIVEPGKTKTVTYVVEFYAR